MSRPALLLLLGLLAWPSAALSAEISLVLSGTDYQGGPAFELSIGKTVLGVGTVDPVPPEGQASEFSFDVPDRLLAVSDPIRVRLTNDAWGGSGKDRNLYIYSVSIAGRVLSPTDFAITSKGQPVERKIRKNHIDIWSSQELAIAQPPAGGWLGTGAALADPQPAAQPAATNEAAQAITPDKPASTASAKCDAKASIIGIDSVSKPLTAAQLSKLVPIVDQARAGLCDIVVTGYASQGGNDSANQAASEKRAAMIMNVLLGTGVKFASASVTGAGATGKFGSDDASNRRVDVALHAPAD